jgi:hypothetical protein
MVHDDTIRILRKIPLEASEEHTLPVGVEIPGQPGRFRKVIIDDMCGEDEQNMAERKLRKNPGALNTVLLQRCVQSIEGVFDKKNPMNLAPAEIFTDQMIQVDRDFLLVAILVLSGKSITERQGICELCGEVFTTAQKFSKLKVYDWPEDRPLYVEGTLPRGHREGKKTHKDIVLAFPTGKIQEMVTKYAKGNQGKMSTLLLASCLKQLGTINDVDSDIASKLKSLDRQYIGSLYKTHFPGIQLWEEEECEDCSAPIDTYVDLKGFFVQAWKNQSQAF